MTAQDDSAPCPLNGDLQPSGLHPEAKGGKKSLRQRFADGWDRLDPEHKKRLVHGLGAITVTALGAALGKRLAPAAPPGEEHGHQQPYYPLRRGRWSNNAGGYWVCAHYGCSKKANPTVMEHECCGRCSPGRRCLNAAQLSYDGPGSFAHNYQEGFLAPGICTVGTCGQSSEAHIWVFDFIRGERRPRP
ncbi:hypothetical protein [Streptomyces sp. NPDC093105]|uniref:hypothetical protein n=1 Tax=Streptomyces sp. NPDC093105 TaxID=3366029 RepID=UPI003804CD4A